MKFLYRLLVAPLGVLLYLLFAVPFTKKAKALFRLRKSAPKNRPELMKGCYWIHASSGEFEYAKSVVREILSHDPAAKIVATYSSPSYAKQISQFEGIAHAEPLPFDLQGPLSDFIRHFEPRMLLVARTDLWPEVLWQCSRYKIPRVLFSCSFPSQPTGLSKAWKSFLYNFLDFIFVIKESDKHTLSHLLNVNRPEIKNIGDTRFDQVLYRLGQANIPNREDQRICFLAGSTWKQDEEVLLPALRDFIKDNELQLILVPHEPTAEHIDFLKNQLKKDSIEFSLFSENKYDFSKPVLIVDKIGILASLYSIADLSFIGGSFKSEVHSVMESLGAGCLTCVGPYFSNNREAVDFSQIQVTPKWNMVNILKDRKDITTFISTVIQYQYDLDEVQAAILEEVQIRKGASQRLVHEIERIQDAKVQSHT